MSEAAAVSEISQEINHNEITVSLFENEQQPFESQEENSHEEDMAMEDSYRQFRCLKESCIEVDMQPLQDFEFNFSTSQSETANFQSQQESFASTVDSSTNEPSLSKEEALIDKVNEFDQKVESLQQFKDGLYQAINEVEQEIVPSNQNQEEPSQLFISTETEQPSQISFVQSDFNPTFELENQKQESSEEELVQENDNDEGYSLKLNLIQSNEDAPLSQETFENPHDDIKQFKSENSTETCEQEIQKLQEDSQNRLQKQSQESTETKIKRIVDDFFNQVETEAASKCLNRRKQFLSGKEKQIEQIFIHYSTPSNVGEALETPKCKPSVQEEQLQQSPMKKRQLQHQQSSDSDISPASQMQQEEGAQFELKPQKIEQSPGKQDPDSESKVVNEDDSSQEPPQVEQQVPPKNEDIVDQLKKELEQREQELKRRQAELQKEKEALRAPFQDLMNKSKKQEAQTSRDKIPAKRNTVTDVTKILQVDSHILNYSSFYPGKLLGSTLNVGNLTNCEQIVELSIDSNSFQYNKKNILDKFGNPELPFSIDPDALDCSGKKSETIVNSEIKHESWYIENPISKELTKRITLKLGPKAEQDFIIVVRSPNAKKTENLLSIINIGVLTYADEQFGVRESFEDFLKHKYNNSMKEFLRDRKKLSLQQRVEILLAGKIEVPSLVCQKELLIADLNEKVIPLCVKKGQQGQKFRIPFKNNGSTDIEIDFTFAKQSAVIQCPKPTDDKPSQLTSPVEFVSMPSNVKIPANGSAILNIAAKLRNSYQLASIREQDPKSKYQRPEKYNHLLIAKVKDTQIMFSFIVEASVIESTGNANNMS